MRYRGRFGILISGTGSNMKALVRAVERSQISADVAFVGSDNPAAPGLIWARERGIETFVVDYPAIYQRVSGGPTRSSLPRIVAEGALIAELKKHDFDLLCLAGFMRLLSPNFINRVSPDPLKPRITNIHPSLLPAFPGTDGYGDTWRYGCKIGGCTVHFVDYSEDAGPIIGQKTFLIEPDDSLHDIKTKGLELEYQLYPTCVRLYFERRLRLVKAKNGRFLVLIAFSEP